MIQSPMCRKPGMSFWQTSCPLLRALFIWLAVAGCGKDSFISEPEPVAAQVESGEGIEILAPG